MTERFDDMFLVDNFETWVATDNSAVALQFETPEGIKSDKFFLTWACVADLVESFTNSKLVGEGIKKEQLS